MPKRTDIQTIAIIGAGPIVIGQACEFDYSGVQACKTLKAEGYRLVLINSNPATIMTDPDLADATYIEPITPDVVAQILEKERPQALLPTMGGQTALNTAMALVENGTLERLGIELIGANAHSIAMAEDRKLFREAMDRIGLESPKSVVVRSLDEGMAALSEIGLPSIIRPSFTLGGTGGGIAYNRPQFEEFVKSGLAASPVHEILVEQSVLGWKEYEMEVVRDKADNCIIVCSIENVDPMGVHTGDSITVAPALTLTDKEYQIMRDASIAVLREIGVDTGGSNVQFAVNPADGRLLVIEMNPRVSRSSALASKATGFPIAKVAARLAVGYTLDEIRNDITGTTPAAFEPTIDYVVTKIPRFAFEKFPGASPVLTTAMKSVGEVMAIGRTFQESLQKALRSLETGLDGLDYIPDMLRAFRDRDAMEAALSTPTPDRILKVATAFVLGWSVEDVHALCKYDRWFLRQIEEIMHAVDQQHPLGQDEPGSHNVLPETKEDWLYFKRLGFSDAKIGRIARKKEADISERRRKAGVRPVFKRIDTCAAEFASETPYMYSTYHGDEDECAPTGRRKIAILGGGPNRIGQGIEFDYCCVHAAYALREAGFETIMVNCNPETVSTDYDTSDRLYFEPLTNEDVSEILHAEMQNGTLEGVIVQLGGQTPLKLAHSLERQGIRILGTSPDAIDLAEDRERFQKLLHRLGLRQPQNGIARSLKEALKVVARIGYPVVIRPSYVLGGRAMEIVHDQAGLERYIEHAVKVSGDNPVLIDSYLSSAIEVDVDVLADGVDVYIAGIMEHIEEAGIHSGDSACALPPYSLPSHIVAELGHQAQALARALSIVGLMNVQFAIKGEDIYVLEVNPRASRTVPFVAKATGIPVAKIAARIMAGEKLAAFELSGATRNYVAVKAPVFPFARFPGVDVILGPEMRSTGEVMGIARDFPSAFAKAQLGAGTRLPTGGQVFISVKDGDKEAIVPIARKMLEMGFRLAATGGTAAYLRDAGLDVVRVNKVLQGSPHILDAMINGEIQFMINTTAGARSITDSQSLRRTALMHSIPSYTTVSGASAAVEAIEALRKGKLEVAPLQTYLLGDC